MSNQVVLDLLQKKFYTGGIIAHIFDVTPALVYHSIDGVGSRAIRVAISRIVNQLPSTLWPDNTIDVKVLDNFYYLASMQLGLSVRDLPKLNEKIKDVRL